MGPLHWDINGCAKKRKSHGLYEYMIQCIDLLEVTWCWQIIVTHICSLQTNYCLYLVLNQHFNLNKLCNNWRPQIYRSEIVLKLVILMYCMIAQGLVVNLNLNLRGYFMMVVLQCGGDNCRARLLCSCSSPADLCLAVFLCGISASGYFRLSHAATVSVNLYYLLLITLQSQCWAPPFGGRALFF